MSNKLVWTSPKLVELGSVEKLTQANGEAMGDGQNLISLSAGIKSFQGSV